MQARGCCLAEFGQVRIAITDRQVAQNLVVSAVLLDDVDHMLDLAAKIRHRHGVPFAQGSAEIVVLRHLLRQRGQFARGRRGKTLKPGFDQLQIVLVGCIADRRTQAGDRAAMAIARIRAGGRFAVNNVHVFAVATQTDRVRIAAGGNQANHGRVAEGVAQGDHGDVVHVAVCDVEGLFVG